MVDLGKGKPWLPRPPGLDDPDRGSTRILGGETAEGCLDKICGAGGSDGG